MLKHLLLPTDGSALSNKAIRHGLKLAKSVKAQVSCLFVTPEYRTILSEGFLVPRQSLMQKSYERNAEAQAAKVLGGVERLAAAQGIKCTKIHVNSNLPYDAIIKTARKRKCDLIVMASHGRGGLQELLLGSETTKVLTHSRIPVLVCR